VRDFHELSDYDFEQIVGDLLSAHWRVEVQSFPRGPDGGVDLRVLGPTGEPLCLGSGDELVVQCKHRPGSLLSALKSELIDEAAKDIVDKACRYILVTSARATRRSKQNVVALFGGRIVEADVLAREDVNALLRQHPQVERANIKLWLTSAAMLAAVTHQTEHLRSAFLRSELEQMRSTYVETSLVHQGRAVLDRLGICILSGPPGVGKTTAASVLALQWMADGWQLITAVGQVAELETQLQPGVRQVLFFDDFLGQNVLEAKLARGEDTELIRLIQAVERDPTKVLILTTREYVLQQAKQTYEKLAADIFDRAKVTVRTSDISHSQRAHILYNLLYYSPVRALASQAIDGPRRYAELVSHPNYNPRLMHEAIAAASRDLGLQQRPSKVAAGSTAGERTVSTRQETVRDLADLPRLLERALDEPTSLWSHVLRHQLSPLQRDMLIAAVSFGTRACSIKVLYAATRALGAVDGGRCTDANLDAAFRVLQGDLLLVQAGRSERTMLRLANPGLADVVAAFICQYPDQINRTAASAVVFEQIRWLADVLSLRPRPGSVRTPLDRELASALASAATRLLLTPSTDKPTPDRNTGDRRQQISFWPDPAGAEGSPYDDFDMRLDVLATLHEAAGISAPAGLGAAVLPLFARAGAGVRPVVLTRVVLALRAPSLAPWRPWRTEVDVAALRRLDRPSDAGDWSLLCDVLSVVQTLPDYLSDLRDRFEDFLDGVRNQLEDQLAEKTPDDVENDLDLNEMERAGRRLQVDVSDIRTMIEEAREHHPEPTRPAPDRASIPMPRKSTASADPEAIFRHL
jgi:hypothetical protein